jgi:hypothetical protein
MARLSSAAQGTTRGPRAHRPRRRLPANLPKTVVVTASITLATAWLFPALSRQWQDRQKARELTAALVTRIGRETSQALITSDFLSSERLPSTSPGRFNQEAFNELDLAWRTSSSEIDAQLQAYYSQDVVQHWQHYALLVQHAYFLPTPDRRQRMETLEELRKYVPARFDTKTLDRVKSPWIARTGHVAGSTNTAVLAYLKVTAALLDEERELIQEILDDHPEGFSTRPRDLAHDLLPFFSLLPSVR